MLAMGLSYMAFTMFTCVPSMPTSWRVFYHKWVLNFVTSLFGIYRGDHMIFILQSFDVVHHTDIFTDIEKFLHPWDKSHLILLIYGWIRIANIC